MADTDAPTLQDLQAFQAQEHADKHVVYLGANTTVIAHPDYEGEARTCPFSRWLSRNFTGNPEQFGVFVVEKRDDPARPWGFTPIELPA